MVSTRHHPRPFPEPTLPPSRSPEKPTTSSASTSSSRTKETPPSPTEPASPPNTAAKRRSISTRRNRTLTSSSPDSPSSTTLTRTSRSKSRAKRRISTSTFTHHPSSLLLTWLVISVMLVTWDTLYVLLRPHTMPGGKYHSPFWTPYALYGTIDYIYGWPAWDSNNGFTAAQALLNVAESLMYGYYAWVVAREVEGGFSKGIVARIWREGGIRVRGRGVEGAVLICFASAVMSLSKTVLYALNEACSSFANVGHNSARNLVVLWIIPNGAWIVLPTYMTYVLGKEIWNAMCGNTTTREE